MAQTLQDVIGMFLARDVIYTTRAYAMMSVSVCLSVTEVNWCIVANLGFKFRSKIYRALSSLGGVISTTTSRAMLATVRPSCLQHLTGPLVLESPGICFSGL